jgi:nitrate reductase NapAB chaperone NapD
MGEYETGKGVDPTLVKIIAGVLILAAAIVLIGSLFSGGADVSSSSGSESNAPGSDGGSEGIIVDSDSSGEFTPTAEVTLPNGVVVKTRGLDIVEMPEGNIPEEDMVSGTMYTHSKYISLAGSSVIIATEKKKMDDISFSVDGISVSNIRPENTRGKIIVFANMQIPEQKKVRTQITGYNSQKEVVSYTNDLNIVTDSIVDGSSPIGTNIHEDHWKDTKLIIIQFSVQNK